MKKKCYIPENNNLREATPQSATSQMPRPLLNFSTEFLLAITDEAVTYMHSLVVFSHSLPLISQSFKENN